MTRREYLINRVVQFLSAWSLRYPRFFRYTVLLFSGEVVLCADPDGLCSGPSNLGIIFVLSIYHFEHSCSAFVASFSSPLDALAVSSPFGSVSDVDTLITTQAYIFWRSLLSSWTIYSILVLGLYHSISHLSFGRLGVYCFLHTPAVSWTGGSFTVTSVTLHTLNSFFEHHWCVTRISCWSVFTVLARMVNLWLRTLDSMNSEEHSQVFVDVNDQRDCPVADEDDSSAILGALSALSGENTRLGATPHTSSLSVSPSMDTPPSHLLGQVSDSIAYSFVIVLSSDPCQTWRVVFTVFFKRILQATSLMLSWDLVLSLWLLTRCMRLRWISAQLRVVWHHDLRLGLQSLANTSDGEDLLRADITINIIFWSVSTTVLGDSEFHCL